MISQAIADIDASTSALIDYGRSMIYYGVSNLRDGVINLLSKTGVQVPPNVDTKTLHIMVLKMGMESPLFKKDMVSLLSDAHSAGGKKGTAQMQAQPPVMPAVAPSAPSPSVEVTQTAVSSASAPASNGGFNGTGLSGVIGDLDEVCNGYVPGQQNSATLFLNQDGDGSDPEASSLQFKDILAKAFDLGIAYVASQGNRGISDEANNAALIEQARQVAAAKARRQALYFNVFLGVAVLATGGYIWYQVKKNKA